MSISNCLSISELAQAHSGLDSHLGVFRNVWDAMKVADLAVKKIPHVK